MLYRGSMKTLAQCFPNAADLARACGVSRQAARYWINGLATPSPQFVPLIVAAADGQITAEQIRPDVEWQRDENGQITGYVVPVLAKAG